MDVIAKLISWSIFKRDSVSWIGMVDISIGLPGSPYLAVGVLFPWMADGAGEPSV